MGTKLRWMCSVVCGFALLGCADAIGPATQLRIAPPGKPQASWAAYGDAPTYEDESEIPADYRDVRIYRLDPGVEWNGRTAEGYVATEYKGNRGELSMKLTVHKGSSQVGSTEATLTHQSFLPYTHLLGQPINYMVSGECGHVANLAATMKAALVVFVKTTLTTFGETSDFRTAPAGQPDCPVEEQVVQVESGETGMTGNDGECCTYWRIDWFWINSDGSREYIGSQYYSECGCG